MITTTQEPIFSIKDNSILNRCIFNLYLLNNNYTYSAYLPEKKKHMYFGSINSSKYKIVPKNLLETINVNICKKNKVFVKTDSISLIPNKLFNAKNLNIYARTLLNNTTQDVWYVNLNSIDAHIIYTIPTTLLRVIKDYFHNIEIVPIDKIIIESLSNYTSTKSSKLLLNIEENTLTISYLKNKNLIFYNNIEYSSTQDLIAKLLNITQRLQIDVYKTSVIISGQTDVKSLYIQEICNYFAKISLAKLPDILNFDASMKNISQHYFYNLFIAPLCA